MHPSFYQPLSSYQVVLTPNLKSVAQVEELEERRPLQDNATKRMILTVAKKAKCTQHMNVRHQCLATPRPTSLLTVLRRVEMVVVLQNATTSTIPMTHRSWHCPLDGSTTREGASTTSQLVAMVEVWWPWWLINVTQERDVMQIMTINLHVPTTLLMHQWLFGKPQECPKMNGVGLILPGLMLDIVKVCLSKCLRFYIVSDRGKF